jgi:hypothetical protein
MVIVHNGGGFYIIGRRSPHGEAGVHILYGDADAQEAVAAK